METSGLIMPGHSFHDKLIWKVGSISWILLLVSTFSYALTFNVATSFKLGDSLFGLYNGYSATMSTEVRFSIVHRTANLDFNISVLAKNDRHYSDPFMDSYYAGFYFDFGNNYVTFNLNPLCVTLGKGQRGDLVDSPYSLFVSPTHLPRNFIELKYEDERFIYISRWTELANLKSDGLPAQERFRGANFKSYALKVGNIRFGYEEVNVYVGKTFDFEFFANPAPGFFIQYVNDAGRPYAEGIGESNFIMGFFADYKVQGFYAYSQLLIDDINMNRFLKPNEFQNPDKIAWSLGTRFDTIYGRLAFYHAGATKYTFQPSGEFGNNKFYGYTVYTDFRYKQQDGKDTILPLELLYMGYKYGENNVAFNLEYEPESMFGIRGAKFGVEYVLLGERSPVNAWGEYSNPPAGTHLLNEPTLERRLILSALIPWKVFDWLTLKLATQFGYVWNRSVPVNVENDQTKRPILRPEPGNNAPIFLLSLMIDMSLNW